MNTIYPKHGSDSGHFEFRVVGFGESATDLVDEIRNLGYEDLQVGLAREGDPINPGKNDVMLIALCPDPCAHIAPMLKAYRHSGVLTLVIATNPLNLPADTYDTLTSVPRSKLVSTAKNLLDPIFSQGSVNVDFNDLADTLRRTGRFVTLSATGRGTERMSDATGEIRSRLPENIDRMCLILHYNMKPDRTQITVTEMKAIMALIEELPASIDFIWGTSADNTLDGDTIRLTAIAAGKDLKKR